MRAVVVFDEWISVSGTLRLGPIAWLSLIVNPPISTGLALYRLPKSRTVPASIAAAMVIGLKVEPSS